MMGRLLSLRFQDTVELDENRMHKTEKGTRLEPGRRLGKMMSMASLLRRKEGTCGS